MDIPTDSPQEEKRGWLGDSLASHRTYTAFFDMRTAWIKWTEDQAYTSSVLRPEGTITSTVPCIFGPGLCLNDPRGQSKSTSILTGVAWGSILPQLSAFTAAYSKDVRYAARLAEAAARYTGLLHSYTNNATHPFPQLLNISSIEDHYNEAGPGWPASSFGDWCPVTGHGCSSVSALLNSVYYILDLDGSLALHRIGGTNSTSPSEAEMAQWIEEARNSFTSAFLHNITVAPADPGTNASSNITGLAFRDLYPAHVTHHGSQNVPPRAQAEAAAGMGVMESVLNDTEAQSHRAALGDMLAALVVNQSTVYDAQQTGGVLDMAHLGRSLVSFGRPDAAVSLLSTDGPTSFYHMAASTGTLWAHPGGSDGDGGKCSSHSHIMQGGSVGEAVFGLGGIRPPFLRQAIPNMVTLNERQVLLAPVPWLPGMPFGAAAWRTLAGVASTRWAVTGDEVEIDEGGDTTVFSNWSVWVNVTVPSGSGVGLDSAQVQIMVPRSAERNSTCLWECGPGQPTAFESTEISFGSTASYRRITAIAPSGPVAAADVQRPECTVLWRSGVTEPPFAVGVSKIDWSPAMPGYFMFPAINVTLVSGGYSFFACPCAS